ncbi:DUF2975 domain-containing protein [Flavobacterium sp. DG1-102-2]|uniref:DUF2975 domain-containing protein n=1 Tax=Flavobacterium sp. DG1-102-2 TaxID=3081663 RepID=UPI00294959E3|nr:DUF2975 domain-containing protein [Flavobacterium sp. DG1-102-2]MDV6167548.1 DUF2975 domain-containing protein [Flavobacterium sp. DG1-102-2]
MKHHLNIIILALRAAITFATGMVLYYFGTAYRLITQNDPALLKGIFANYFTPLYHNTIDGNRIWLGTAFCIAYGLLLIYIIIGITCFYRCLLRIEKGKMFYHTQGNQFRRAGSTFIIFAKVKYVLFVATGTLLYFDVKIFFTEIPAFLALYLIGKLILVMSHMAEKGEFIKEENELTI